MRHIILSRSRSTRIAIVLSVTVRMRGPLAIVSPKGDHADVASASASASASVSVAGENREVTYRDPIAQADLTLSNDVRSETLASLTVSTEMISGEGSPAPVDPTPSSTLIGHYPDDFDSDDNRLDFASMTATSGSTNTCS